MANTTNTPDTYSTNSEVETTPKEIEQVQEVIKKLEAEEKQIAEAIPIVGKLQSFDQNWRIDTLTAWKEGLSTTGQEAFDAHVGSHSFKILAGTTCIEALLENMEERKREGIPQEKVYLNNKIQYMWKLHRKWKTVFPERGEKARFDIIEFHTKKTLVVGGIRFRNRYPHNGMINYEPYDKEDYNLDGTEDMSLRC